MPQRRADLLTALTLLQSHYAHAHHDILTITRAMSDREVWVHIQSQMRRVSTWADHGGFRGRA
jgi:hypothetical protein